MATLRAAERSRAGAQAICGRACSDAKTTDALDSSRNNRRVNGTSGEAIGTSSRTVAVHPAFPSYVEHDALELDSEQLRRSHVQRSGDAGKPRPAPKLDEFGNT